MASRRSDELPRDARDSASVSEHLSRCGGDGIAEEPQPDAAKPQKPGKFKRTALTFFGVRKGICILPSFFGGRSKHAGKWSSKKGLTKSRTHDGLSKVNDDDFEFHCQRGSAGDLHVECSPNAATEQKSLTSTRQKKGLRGLFHSFKHHRNNKNVGLDKAEMIAMTSTSCKMEPVPVVQDNANTECLESESNVPDFAEVTLCEPSVNPQCFNAEAMALETSQEQEIPKCEADVKVREDQKEELNFVADVVSSREYEERSKRRSETRLKLQEMPEPKSVTPAGSSDQLDLIFGDVSSLKSFDSLTGCGDIIADQEDDSISESTISGERSRNGGKRASCYLTYQGGGEEMASPDDLGEEEECLNDFWESNASDEICYTCNQDHTSATAELTSSHNMDLLNSSSAQQASNMEASMADVLTPQSEHQESVPNSDEGYYDSTTPGQDEGQERTDRLTRDSYSGDALYELFAPDESLISPHYESKPRLPTSKQCEYSGEPVRESDADFLPEMNRLQIKAELYGSKSQQLLENVVGLQDIAMKKNCNLNSKPQVLANKNNTESGLFEEKKHMLSSPEKRTKSMNLDCEKRHSSISFGSTSDPDFETFCEPEEPHLEENKPVALPYRNISSQSPDRQNDLDDGQTVSFSQALVDYTKRSQMLSNLHNDTDDLETHSAFTPNMQALPTIVTFDVVDMHNEGEYDEQIHMELEEDISSPYQEFEESYLQKDAFAECEYQMLDLYEQDLISNAWAISSLPRHLGLTRVSQSVPNPLSLDRRSRSLDRESLELNAPDAYRENRASIVPCSSQSLKDPDRDSSPYYKKNVLVCASEARDSGSIMALSWQARPNMALALPLGDGEMAGKVLGLSETQIKKQKMFSGASSSDFPPVSSCDVDSRLPHGAFDYSEMVEEVREDLAEDHFCNSASNLQPYNQCGKIRAPAIREGMSHTGSPLKAGVFRDKNGHPQ